MSHPTSSSSPPATTPPHITILGSGVLGLTIAVSLARRGYSRVHVVARDTPGTSLQSREWASPWAGANWCPFGTNPRIVRWETEGYARLSELIPTGLAMRLPCRRFADSVQGLHEHWYEEVVEDYRHLTPPECPAASVGVAFTTLSVHAPRYLVWLERQARQLGVTITSGRVVGDVRELVDVVPPDGSLVINATGLGARTLQPFADPLVEPIRGQVVLVRAPRVRECTMDASDPQRGARYIIPRPSSSSEGDYEAVLGGCYDVGSYDTTPDPALAQRILRDCLALDPRLSRDGTIDGIDVIAHNVGLRPSRQGGPRLEWEPSGVLELKNGAQVEVLHAYGIGPAGYQASWGIAREACEMVGRRVEQQRRQEEEASRDDVDDVDDNDAKRHRRLGAKL